MAGMEKNMLKLWNKLWDKKVFRYAMLSAALWSLVHVYAVSRLMVSHDSLAEFYAGAMMNNGYTGITWKLALGRFVTPIYQKLLRGTVTLPWLIGLLSSVFMGLTVYVIARIFEMKRAFPVFMTAGVMMTSPTVFLTAATFIHDMDVNMLGMLLAALAVWCWKEDRWLLWLAGAVCVSLCMGVYACFLSMTVVMIMFVSILALLRGEKPMGVLVRGLKAIAMILAGLALYAVMALAVCRLAGMELVQGHYNSITNMVSQSTRDHLPERIASSYQDVARALGYEMFGHSGSRNLASVAVIAAGMAVIAVKAIRGKIGFFAGAMIVVLLGLLPVAMDLSVIVGTSITYSHDLMKCAFVLAYLLALLLADGLLCEPGKTAKAAGAFIALCIAVICWQYTVQANQIYLKKDLENRFTSSQMTRIMTQVEQRNDYVPGETKLLFAGDITHHVSHRSELNQYWGYTGVGINTPIQTWSLYKPYLEYMMGIRVNYCSGEERWALVTDQRVIDMPVYPQEGSIQMIDDVLVIRVGP